MVYPLRRARKNETYAECCLREIEEELGYVVK
ncbi:NUDIX hydrolase [Virgibacillus necropolis]